MKRVKILDTTLRDGGRVIDCAFTDEQINGITTGLIGAGIDIVEMGFLRGSVKYSGNSTFFSELEQVKQFIPQIDNDTMFVVFSDYGKEYDMWDFSRIKPCDGKTIKGFRVGYRKKDLHKAIDTFKTVKDNGYKLFIQGVESLNYTDMEMLEALKIINEISPYAFGIVDTYGRMYKRDVMRLYNLIENNLSEDIALDFHFHNNMQLAFSFAQEVIECRKGSREIIIDATLEGVTRGAGNLNTELITDYLNREHFYTYEMDKIFDTIDEYVTWIKSVESWAYSVPYYLAGIYSSHTNNISYLMDKHKLSSRDIKHIISMIEPDKRKRYDYDNIEKTYIEYVGTKIDDSVALETIKNALLNKAVLILAPGQSLTEYEADIDKFIADTCPIVISVNFILDKFKDGYAFFGNPRRYGKLLNGDCDVKTIVSSNISELNGNELVVNYNSLIDRGFEFFDNSTVILLNLLRNIGVEEIYIAGLDGFEKGKTDHYFHKDYNNVIDEKKYDTFNNDLKEMLRNFAKTLQRGQTIKFITPSQYEFIFD